MTDNLRRLAYLCVQGATAFVMCVASCISANAQSAPLHKWERNVSLDGMTGDPVYAYLLFAERGSDSRHPYLIFGCSSDSRLIEIYYTDAPVKANQAVNDERQVAFTYQGNVTGPASGRGKLRVNQTTIDLGSVGDTDIFALIRGGKDASLSIRFDSSDGRRLTDVFNIAGFPVEAFKQDCHN